MAKRGNGEGSIYLRKSDGRCIPHKEKNVLTKQHDCIFHAPCERYRDSLNRHAGERNASVQVDGMDRLFWSL